MDRSISRRAVLQSGVVGVVGAAVAGRLGPSAKGSGSNANTPRPDHHYPTIDIRADCGAKGDGTTNDTAAFQLAAHLLQEAGGGTLNIPKGTYVVGVQNHTAATFPYWITEDVFSVMGLEQLIINGNNATVRMAAGIHYGSFDPETGESFTPTARPFRDLNYAVTAGIMFEIQACRKVIVTDLELDGNNENLAIGGGWGGSDIQLLGDGLWFGSCTNVTVKRVKSHHHARDGVYVTWPAVREGDPATPHTLVQVESTFNGRQGLSWTGGRGLSVYDSQFSHTGRAVNVGTGQALHSRPSKGVDIEPPGSMVRDGYFENCEFVNNFGIGAAGSNPQGGWTTYRACTFWGTTSYSVWCAAPEIKFIDCNLYGDVYHVYGSDDPDEATSFVGCHFEDKPWTDGNVYTGRGFLCVSPAADAPKNALWRSCTFVANANGSLATYGTDPQRVEDCTFIHKDSALPDGSAQAILNGCAVSGCQFEEDLPTGSNSKYYIECNNTSVDVAPPTVVDGPRIAWNAVGGATGRIPAGTYTS